MHHGKVKPVYYREVKNANWRKLIAHSSPACSGKPRKIAERYRIVIHFEDGDYYGQALELPGAMNDGKDAASCVENTIDILTTAIATMLENGITPPMPASEDKRDEQVNVRLSKLEKMTFEQTARSRGFRGISEFMRTAALTSVALKG